MSFLIASPEALAATATYLTGIGSAISAANAVAAAPTTEILAAGTDEVSTAISALFGAHAQAYQALSAHVAAFHDQFVHTLTAGAGSYMAAEAAAASPLQALQLELLNAINAPTLALLGRPLIGDGTDAAPGSGGAGGAGGILIGNGGTGGASDLAGTGRGGVGGAGGAAGSSARPDRIHQHQDPPTDPDRVRIPLTTSPHRPSHAHPRRPPPHPARPTQPPTDQSVEPEMGAFTSADQCVTYYGGARAATAGTPTTTEMRSTRPCRARSRNLPFGPGCCRTVPQRQSRRS